MFWNLQRQRPQLQSSLYRLKMMTADRDGRFQCQQELVWISYGVKQLKPISLNLFVKQVQGKQEGITKYIQTESKSFCCRTKINVSSNQFTFSYEKMHHVWLKLYHFILFSFPPRGCSDIFFFQQYNSQKLKHVKKPHNWNTLTTKIHFFIGFDLP